MAVSSVLNMTQLLRHVPASYRGRVFSAIESLTWSVMMVSMMEAGVAWQHYDLHMIGAVSGVLSSMTALAWGLLDVTLRLPEPKLEGVAPEEVEVHGQPTV